MTIRVLGVDPSLAATGLALASPRDTYRTISPHAGADDVPRRLYELQVLFENWLEALQNRNAIDVAVVETVSLHGIGGPLVVLRLGQLSGVFLAACSRYSIPVVEVNSSSLKKYATGNGSATKPDMMKAAKNLGGHPSNDNEADAFFLKKIGDDFYNRTPAECQAVLEKHQLELQDRLKWPRL